MSSDAKGEKCLLEQVAKESRVVDEKVNKMVEKELVRFQRRKK